MAAFVSSARPISQILPGEFDLFPSQSSSSSSPSSSTLRPRPQGHYRPHSTLFTDSPYIELEKPPRLLKRSSSFGGLQSLQKMNLGLTLKSRRNVHSPSASQFGTSSPKVSLPLSHKPRPPKTITHVTKSPPPIPPLRKKRSMISLFSTASEPQSSSPTERSVPSPLGARPVVIPPSIPEHSPPKPTTKPKPNNSTYDSTLPPFVPKSIWAMRSNMKLHPYQSEVPYMQAYDPILLESDRYSDLLLQRLLKGSASFSEFHGKGPSTVLDLGCGEGHWIIYASSIWKDAEFTGFDLVDVTTSTFRSLENVHFVQGDFVKYRLPFPDNTFDFVRMANLLLCVPYLCWAKLFAEVRRILTDKGRIEVIDDQLFFPYSSPPMMKERPRSFESNSSVPTGDLDSDLDGDTLHGYGSGEDSTFNSDGTCASSFEDEPSHMSSFPTSETVRPVYRSRFFSLDTSKKEPLDKYETGQADSFEWKEKAIASHELEQIFQTMLLKYGLIPQPSQALCGLLQYTFGKSARKIKSFHIKLAEWASPIGPTKKDMVDVAESKDSLVENNPGNKKKPWSTTKIDWETKKSKKKDQILASVEMHSDFFILETPIPDSVKPKAAKKLGLDININPTTPSMPIPKEKKDKTPPSYSPLKSSAPFAIPVSSSPFRSNTVQVPNAKTAALLGVSYSQLAHATVQATTARSLLKPRGLIQSPGLLIGDGEYMAIDPVELEMHACKYIHTLLGCRLALGLFVSQQRDEDGKQFVDEETFSTIIWNYEMFRRARLGWPSGNELDQVDEEPESKEQLYDSFHKSLVDRSQRDEPVPIRTIRVYEGRKLDDYIPFGVYTSEAPEQG